MALRKFFAPFGALFETAAALTANGQAKTDAGEFKFFSGGAEKTAARVDAGASIDFTNGVPLSADGRLRISGTNLIYRAGGIEYTVSTGVGGAPVFTPVNNSLVVAIGGGGLGATTFNHSAVLPATVIAAMFRVELNAVNDPANHISLHDPFTDIAREVVTGITGGGPIAPTTFLTLGMTAARTSRWSSGMNFGGLGNIYIVGYIAT